MTNTLSATTARDNFSEIDGAGLETLVLQHLRAINDYYNLGYQLSYWRTSEGKEVDFVLYGKNGFYAFEVKRATKIERMDLGGLKAFQEDYPQAKCYVVFGGEEKEYREGITLLPITTCLQNLLEILTSK